MTMAALGPAAGVLCLSVLIVLALQATEPQELAPLPTTGDDMRRYAEAGYFPLMAAASAAERHALSTAAGLQTFGSLVILFASTVHAGWRGFTSARARGWSNGFWVAGVIGLCLAPSILHGLSPQILDYLVTSSASYRHGAFNDIYGEDGLNSRMLPAAFIVERGIFCAGLLVFFALLAHDLGYRLREALEDFGLIEEDESRRRRGPSPGARQGPAGKSRPRTEARAGHDGESAFGQRQAPPSWSAPPSAEARARAVLGVGASASRREIERAFRSQMKRAHPDHGGPVERAAALNAARDLLLGRR